MTREKFIKKWLGNKDYQYTEQNRDLMRDDLDEVINQYTEQNRDLMRDDLDEVINQALRQPSVVGRSEQLLAFKTWEAEKCKLPWDASPEQIIEQYLTQ